MAVVDFTTYTEVDPGTKIAVTSTKIDVTTMLDSDDARVYKDMGAAHFAGDFEHLITASVSSATVSGLGCVVWGLWNITTAEITNPGTEGEYIRAYEETASAASFALTEYDAGSGYQDFSILTLSLNTPYYLKIKRDEAVGTYGTLYGYIYSDSGRTTLVDTMTITLHTSKKDYQYVYGYAGWGTEAGAYSWTGYTENLDLQESIETLRPSAAGDLTELAYKVPAVANYLNVDESSADDATTTNSHNGTDNTSAKDLYNITDSAIGAGTITGVIIHLRAQGNLAWYKTLIKTHATEYLGAQASSASGFSTTSTAYTTNPNTSAAWTWTEINDLQIGVQEYRHASEVGYVTQVYAEVYYVPGAASTFTPRVSFIM